MVPGGEFRHDAAVGLVHCDLAMQAVGQQAQLGVIDRDRRLIAGAFNSKYTHNFRLNRITNGACLAPGAPVQQVHLITLYAVIEAGGRVRGYAAPFHKSDEMGRHTPSPGLRPLLLGGKDMRRTF